MQEPLCSWDSAIDERYNDYTTGNTEEVLPGITRPLPADLIREWDHRWLELAVEDLGIGDLFAIPEIPHSTMLPVIAGQWCVNIGIVNGLTATFETGGSADYLKQFFDAGTEVQAEDAVDLERARAIRAEMESRWDRAAEILAADTERATAAYRAARERDWSAASDAELIAAVDATTELAGSLFVDHYVISTAGGQGTTLLGGLLDEHVPGHPTDWPNRLTSGLSGIESTKPSKAIWDLSRIAAARPALAAELPGLSVDVIQRRLASPPDADWSALAEAYRAFLDELGFRAQRETDPSCETWDEAPNFVISSLLADLAAGPERDPHAMERARAGERAALEREVEAALPAEVREQYRRLLRWAQAGNGGRETTKANWARTCRTYRPPIRELGGRLAAKGTIAAADDVWFLRLPELRAGAAGTLDAAETKASIASRKEEYERLHDLELPALFQRPVEATPKAAPEQTAAQSYQALGVSPGKATGPARVIVSAEAAMDAELHPGEILVAPFTDAPWTPLFIPAAGVVVETGGVLSHAATVAREYGIPAVAGVRGATTAIPNGAILAIDGTTGEVTVELP